MDFKAICDGLDGIPGDVVEVGVGGGGSGWTLLKACAPKQFWAYDTFNGFPVEQAVDGEELAFVRDIGTAATETVHQGLTDHGAECVKGSFPSTFWVKRPDRVSLVHLDVDTYVGTRSGLDLFSGIMSVGGQFLVHDYGNPRLKGVVRAVEGFLAERKDFVLRTVTPTDYAVLERV